MRSTVGVEEASWSADLLAGRTIGPRSTFGRDSGEIPKRLAFAELPCTR